MSVRLSSWFSLILFLSSLRSEPATTLTLAAAADLSPAQNSLTAAFRKNEPNIQVRFVIGASVLLAQQIENGAPYDVFLSADAALLEHLSSIRKIEPNSVQTYATGRVAVLWKDHKSHPINELTRNWVRFVALPNPQLAPYGARAQEALQHARVWDRVKTKVVYGENVRQALQLFDSGNADAVLTSASLLSDRSPQLIPADWHQPILQKGGVVSASPNQDAAKLFLKFLTGPEGQTVLAKFGFAKITP